MAKSKTGSFWLTEVVSFAAADPSGTVVSGTIDLGAYVDVGDQQAVAVESVDFMWQRGTAFSGDYINMTAGPGALQAQLLDLNPGGAIVRSDDHSLIADGILNIGGTDLAGVLVNNNVGTSAANFYPDTYGKLDESRMVVNDNLYLQCAVSNSAIGAHPVDCTVRIKCRIVKLSTKDWMALAIQSTAADN